MKKTIQHQALKVNTFNPTINCPKTLVLGSFNPFENEDKSVDYFYGRKTNHFWREIGIVLFNDEFHFFGKDGYSKKLEIMNERFFCLDVINSIDLECRDENLLKEYIESEIYSNFSDKKIWCGKAYTKKSSPIVLKRSYNHAVIDFLKKTDSISTVIHTMGVNTIYENGTNPKEKKSGKSGFLCYIETIKEICIQKGITFINESYSPSDYAIKTNKTDKNVLRLWLKDNLML